MNVFEDLVVELKKDNLLEQTVIDVDQTNDHDIDDIDVETAPVTSYDLPQLSAATVDSAIAEPECASTPDEDEVEKDLGDPLENSPEVEAAKAAERPIKVANGKEFFQKHAVSEVSSLQMVEHVLTGVEREYMKIIPNTFDDFNVKKALNTFVNVVGDVKSEEHTGAEFNLMQETEAWCSELANRDRSVPVSSLRQYCENSRPALSSQALLALARFYRNLPYSEAVRSKFDFVITRLFSRSSSQEKRTALFTSAEALAHITTLYKDWSSIPLYTADEDESNVLLTALSFEDLAMEAESAVSFDQLIEGDFFGRLKLFKESISELFYAPNVTAAAIECNIRIGNAYVELIGRERQKMNAESLQSKYGDLHDACVSDAAARTLELVEVLRMLPDAAANAPEPGAAEYEVATPDILTPAAESAKKPVQVEKAPAGWLHDLKRNALSINRWFLGAAIFIAAVSIGLYVWANFVISENIPSAAAAEVPIENAMVKEHTKSIRMASETYHALMEPSWDLLPKEKRQDVLLKMLQACREKGCKQVRLINKDGKPAGYASATKLEVIMP